MAKYILNRELVVINNCNLVLVTVVDHGEYCDLFEENLYTVYTHQVNRNIDLSWKVGAKYLPKNLKTLAAQMADHAVSTRALTSPVKPEEFKQFLECKNTDCFTIEGFVFNAVAELIAHPDTNDLELLTSVRDRLTFAGRHIASSRINALIMQIEMQPNNFIVK